ncbi:hypothetical protein AAHH79_44370, partial [Burkholderia pseudomallei]
RLQGDPRFPNEQRLQAGTPTLRRTAADHVGRELRGVALVLDADRVVRRRGLGVERARGSRDGAVVA